MQLLQRRLFELVRPLGGISRILACATMPPFMPSVRAFDPRYRCLAWVLVALALLIAPTSVGRGTLLMLIEGPCPPDCSCEVDGHDPDDEASHAAGEEPRFAALGVTLEEHDAAGHACAGQADDHGCPPDCGDCTCCGAPAVAVVDRSDLLIGSVEAFQLHWCGPPSPVRAATRRGLYRPPKPSLA